jgi:hypothetical protein
MIAGAPVQRQETRFNPLTGQQEQVNILSQEQGANLSNPERLALSKNLVSSLGFSKMLKYAVDDNPSGLLNEADRSRLFTAQQAQRYRTGDMDSEGGDDDDDGDFDRPAEPREDEAHDNETGVERSSRGFDEDERNVFGFNSGMFFPRNGRGEDEYFGEDRFEAQSQAPSTYLGKQGHQNRERTSRGTPVSAISAVDEVRGMFDPDTQAFNIGFTAPRRPSPATSSSGDTGYADYEDGAGIEVLYPKADIKAFVKEAKAGDSPSEIARKHKYKVDEVAQIIYDNWASTSSTKYKHEAEMNRLTALRAKSPTSNSAEEALGQDIRRAIGAPSRDGSRQSTTPSVRAFMARPSTASSSTTKRSTATRSVSTRTNQDTREGQPARVSRKHYNKLPTRFATANADPTIGLKRRLGERGEVLTGLKTRAERGLPPAPPRPPAPPAFQLPTRQSQLPTTREGFVALAAQINANGGINGEPIKVYATAGPVSNIKKRFVSRLGLAGKY